MGQKLSRVFTNSSTSSRILVLGLPGSGKSTLLHSLKLGQVKTLTPTIYDVKKGFDERESTKSFKLETVTKKKYTFFSWDIIHDREEVFEVHWKTYLSESDAVIWVVDSSDHGNIQRNVDEFYKLMAHEDMKDVIVLILGNKSDLGDSTLTERDLTEKFQLISFDRKWGVFRISAKSLDGVLDCMAWLVKFLKEKELERTLQIPDPIIKTST
jgi:small GTP-binding protein